MPEIQENIKHLKNEKDAIIIAHNYQLPEVQEAADYVGDSLGLAKMAQNSNHSLIVMCGVYFMAETAALLNPNKTVLIPDEKAGCPLSDFATAAKVAEWKKTYPDYAFVSYVNSSAEVKAMSDICCTSSNAIDIVRAVDNDKIVFLPDKNLGAYVKKNVPEKDIVLWPGYCIVHENADMGSILKAKMENPGALLIAHPECRMEVLNLADGICSTGQMSGFIEKNNKIKKFIIITERGMIYALKKKFSDIEFIEPETKMQCANMKKITIEKLYNSLENNVYRVQVAPETSIKARLAIEKMLALTA